MHSLATVQSAENADQFLQCAADFQLGSLATEQPHPLTLDLSGLSQEDLPKAIDQLKQVDLLALETMAKKLEPAAELATAIAETWRDGGRIFLAGCGATGRLSLALETFCREGLVPKGYQARVVAFMAGGDAALIRSIEGFEDFPAYGARQLRELGFERNDLLIASTEGGETPWVIGTTEEAAEISHRRPWFCYCNEDEPLGGLVDRSRRVLENPSIAKWNLAVGPMAIAGSTRMQASTVLQLGIGLALEIAAKGAPDRNEFCQRLDTFRHHVDTLDWTFLAGFISREAEIYQSGDHVLYATDKFGVTVLTDTTERSPTFSLPVFENYTGGSTTEPRSLCYLSLSTEPVSELAWQRLLRRDPRCLDWPPELTVTRRERLIGYDISSRAAHLRATHCGEAHHHIFSVDEVDGAVTWALGRLAAEAVPAHFPMLEKQTLLKMLLNTHSTLIMGRLGRYEGNLMTYVKPSNNKLIDRAIRYVQTLHERQTGQPAGYERVCRELFRQREKLAPDEPIVLKTLAAILKQNVG